MTSTSASPRLLGTFIRNRRHQLGLSLRDLEQRTGISNSRLSRWERGDELPDHPRRLVPLAASLDLDLADLYTLAGIPTASTTEMPSLPTYLRQRYPQLSVEAIDELCRSAEVIARQHRTTLDIPIAA